MTQLLVSLLALPALLSTTAGDPPVVEVAELDAAAEEWAGRSVTVVGELVGDYSPRSTVVWVQLNDDAYAEAPLEESGRLAGTNIGIGVRMPPVLFDPDAWGRPGGYRRRGPLVEVTGIFHSGGRELAGDTFVDAEEVRLIEPARSLEPSPLDPAPFVIGATAAVAGLAALAWARWRELNPP